MSFDVKFSDIDENCCARMLIGYNTDTGSYFSIGIGDYGRAYESDVFDGNVWRAHKAAGSISQIIKGKVYKIEVKVNGQRVNLSVDSVQVLSDVLPTPLSGNQAGLLAWGNQSIEF